MNYLWHLRTCSVSPNSPLQMGPSHSRSSWAVFFCSYLHCALFADPNREVNAALPLALVRTRVSHSRRACTHAHALGIKKNACAREPARKHTYRKPDDQVPLFVCEHEPEHEPEPCCVCGMCVRTLFGFKRLAASATRR